MESYKWGYNSTYKGKRQAVTHLQGQIAGVMTPFTMILRTHQSCSYTDSLKLFVVEEYFA